MRVKQAFVGAQCTVQLNCRPLLQYREIFSQFTSQRFNSHVAQTDRRVRVAIVGSGPAGFYAAYRLLTKQKDAIVDMYEKLPVPFGLARYGVAPDHPEVKNCEDKFTEVAKSTRFNFVGNIDLGHDLPLAALKPHYDAIIFAYGATKDKELGIPGEEALHNVHSARAFVGWYNGLPEHRDLDPDLSGENAVIVGQGNVALDVARILLSDVATLQKTDIADYAVEKLSKSRIKRVRVVGRRGPLQASFTIKELREMLQLPGVSFDPIPEDIFPPEEVVSALPRAQKRLMQLLAKGSANDPLTAPKSWSLDFLLAPDSLHWSPDYPYHLSHVKFSRNELDPSDPHSPSTKVFPKHLSSGKRAQVNLPTSIFFRSVGYKSLPLPGLEDLGIDFDTRRGIIPNDGFGRIISFSSKGEPESLPGGSLISYLPGLYCAGWVKRGPTGVIASTMTDAFTTADTIVQDLTKRADSTSLLHAPDHSSGLGWDGVKIEAQRRGLRPTSWKDWQRIDAAEREGGQLRGKPRDKFGRVEEMLRVLD
ncbi:NADPH-adrenodoxin reductase Arh1, putative [Penicillium digitatum]|uniref:NADPH:adrenodoxin oxidoreductase, mitochondrial n=3 Tax=Penicillium digitatum TaxID=36651 RepID=K9F7U2_PEND2|nr:NADPH-adrenodoxin reductase Arh1, putative [Penicillium digitatum Pd1]EKV04082.1 NADPH-adrenodoxin reductase Arh1, putative [Penicillium digitatum Pd1]EKV05425.1 NADPH-adrenodoxin reductase Arh1, putative [Penicillium digitatum PHI26]QQK45143.1 NADPH-adrenodoxin reductase Arh1, putative [Penicillium digitatum]